jgi:hypothetical protein
MHAQTAAEPTTAVVRFVRGFKTDNAEVNDRAHTSNLWSTTWRGQQTGCLQTGLCAKLTCERKIIQAMPTATDRSLVQEHPFVVRPTFVLVKLS